VPKDDTAAFPARRLMYRCIRSITEQILMREGGQEVFDFVVQENEPSANCMRKLGFTASATRAHWLGFTAEH